MQRKKKFRQQTALQLKPQLYSISTTNVSFQDILAFFKNAIGLYPGTLLRDPIAFDHLTIKENILMVYSIVYPRKRNKEQTIEEAFEDKGINLDHVSRNHFDVLSLQMTLKIQLITHSLCNTKLIVMDDWLSELPEEDIKKILLFLQTFCQHQECTILILSTNKTIIKRCDETLDLDSHLLFN